MKPLSSNFRTKRVGQLFNFECSDFWILLHHQALRVAQAIE